MKNNYKWIFAHYNTAKKELDKNWIYIINKSKAWTREYELNYIDINWDLCSEWAYNKNQLKKWINWLKNKGIENEWKNF